MAKNRKVYHVKPGKKGGWDVKKEGGERVSKHTERKKEAETYARQKAKSEQPSQVKVHKQNGTLQTEWTYGNDPEKYKG